LITRPELWSNPNSASAWAAITFGHELPHAIGTSITIEFENYSSQSVMFGLVNAKYFPTYFYPGSGSSGNTVALTYEGGGDMERPLRNKLKSSCNWGNVAKMQILVKDTGFETKYWRTGFHNDIATTRLEVEDRKGYYIVVSFCGGGSVKIINYRTTLVEILN